MRERSLSSGLTERRLVLFRGALRQVSESGRRRLLRSEPRADCGGIDRFMLRWLRRRGRRHRVCFLNPLPSHAASVVLRSFDQPQNAQSPSFHWEVLAGTRKRCFLREAVLVMRIDKKLPVNVLFA